MAVRLLAVLMLLLASPAQPATTTPDKHTFEVAGLRRTFYIYAPADAGSPTPLLLTLHGSYGKADDMLERWIPTAQANGFIVAAPVARKAAAWQIRADGPQFIRAVVAEIERLHAIDPRRIYLFGHSGGAVYALTLSMLESEFFAATAVFAGAWREPKEFIAVPHARRAIAVALYIGDRDEYFALQDVRKTHEALQTAGHPSNLTVLPGRSHNYSRVADEVNPAAWNWLKVYSSNAAPVPTAQ
ncbi:dienelactone hydrolase family protein [Steroidobacter sp. S1-65]|uniref:Dienelactone hydrolase family protein n=1 Tax=Steroidobacter gossypii TaxID=2805490 RepID=A0ABS1WRC1_9GAMM|nr:dienelactone hydrolase family protein [Steroidobacter gossypii]MBM0103524.1 dienelactone hydrolase family protein [Steroidobacter gossypii]